MLVRPHFVCRPRTLPCYYQAFFPACEIILWDHLFFWLFKNPFFLFILKFITECPYVKFLLFILFCVYCESLIQNEIFPLFVLILKLKKLIVHICVFYQHVCLCTTCVLGDRGGKKNALDPLELEFQMVVSCLMGAGNWTWFSGKKPVSLLLSHLSSPLSVFENDKNDIMTDDKNH